MKYFTLPLVLIAFSSSLYPQWQLQNSGTAENLNDLAILNQTTTIVVGENGTILKTTSSGIDWLSKNSGTANQLNAVSFYDEENGIAVGDGVLCRTSDGGENWISNYINKNGVTICYRYRDFNLGSIMIIGCDDGTIYLSNNDEITKSDTAFSIEPIVATDFNFSWQFDLAYAVTISYTASNIFPSNLWTLYQNLLSVEDDLTGGDLHDWFQYLIGVGGFSGLTPFILKKQWSDTLWVINYSFVPTPYIPNDIVSYDNKLFICGTDGKIYSSTDFGDNWSEQFTGITNTLNAITIRCDSIGFSVGDNGTILFTSNGGGINSVNEIIPPNEIVLYQNYPNPFNPATNIEYKLNSRQYVQLKVFDALGNEITTLVNEEQPAGSYNFEFNPSLINPKPSSGIYFYKLTAISDEGNSVQTRKMIYLK